MPNDKNGGLNGSRSTCCRQEPEKRILFIVTLVYPLTKW